MNNNYRAVLTHLISLLLMLVLPLLVYHVLDELTGLIRVIIPTKGHILIGSVNYIVKLSRFIFCLRIKTFYFKHIFLKF